MRKVTATVELVKGDDFVIVGIGSRAHEHFVALEYRIKGEVVEQEKKRGRPKRRVKSPSPAQI